MKIFSVFFLTLILPTFAAPEKNGPSATNGEQELWYRRPAERWGSEALPIGNGRLGAMLFGGVKTERIQFNEISLWGGANNWDGGYDLKDTGFGGYRNFGDLFIDWGQGDLEISSPSGHATGNGQGIENSTDGNPGTKWCIEAPGASVSWLAKLPAPVQVASYALTSASDVPDRDPKDWELEASEDGGSWQTLDKQHFDKPFPERGKTQTFNIQKPGAFRFYRLIFSLPAGASHFQIADISLAGVKVSMKEENIPKDYRRSLNISNGLHRVVFTTKNGTKMAREAFASRPAQALVFRYTASNPGSLSGRIRLKPGQNGATCSADFDTLAFTGELENKLHYACVVRVLHDGGKISAEAGDGTVTFSNCDTLTLVLDARTDYKPSFSDGWRGEAPMPIVRKEIAAVSERISAKKFDEVRNEHIADLSGLLGKATLNLGGSTSQQTSLPTDERIARSINNGDFAKGGDDPGLDALIFQMGRYLLASSSRPGGLPANLQGLWNDSNSPAWACDYHNNINVQMNYWPAESTGLGECAVPLVDFVVDQAEPCRIATKKAFGQNVRGWTARTSQSPLGGNGWDWNIPASAWYALHVFDHWDFSRDNEFLKKTAYPVLKEVCQYWEDRLKPLPDGKLVAPQGWSPEHGPREDGVMHDQQLIWELFDDYIKASQALGVDADYRKKIAEMQSKLAPNKIGKWGQLQEWQEDRDDPKDLHRHTSHLFALYPGRQINPVTTPDLAKAARVSLLARSNDTSDKTGKPWTPADMQGDSLYSWVWPWRASMWARLGEGDRAHMLVWGKIGNTGPNMLSLYSPWFKTHNELIQLDGAFGATGAIAEMLLQSHAGEIHILPALPKAWAKKGSFTGLRARGGFSVDCAWRDGRPVSVVLRGKPGSSIPVHIGNKRATVTISPSGQNVLKLQ